MYIGMGLGVYEPYVRTVCTYVHRYVVGCVCTCTVRMHMYLEGDVGILMHAKDLWLIAEGQALNVLSVCLYSVGFWGIVNPCSGGLDAGHELYTNVG